MTFLSDYVQFFSTYFRKASRSSDSHLVVLKDSLLAILSLLVEYRSTFYKKAVITDFHDRGLMSIRLGEFSLINCLMAQLLFLYMEAASGLLFL